MAQLTWNEFAPDLDPLSQGACQDMTGVFPVEKGFRTLPGLSAISNGLPSTCYGAYTAYLLGTSVIVLATATGLYTGPSSGGRVIPGPLGLLNGSAGRSFSDGVENSTTTLTSATASFAASDVGRPISGTGIPAGTMVASFTNSTTIVMSAAATQTATGITITLGTLPINRWRFSVYGKILIAVDGVDADYAYADGSWAPLAGSPPVASLTCTTDYAVILIPPNSQTLFSNLSPTASWSPNAAAEVFSYDLAQIPGNISAVTKKRSYLAVYRSQALQSATFVGGEIGWDFGSPGTISQTIGAANQEAVINTGDYDYFVGPDFDFWQFDGYNLNRIPNHCKEFFSRDLNQGFVQNIAGRYDVNRNLIIWHYPSNATARGQAGNLDSYIGFYMRPQPPRWFFGRLPVELPLQTPAVDPLHVSTTPDSGIVQTDHNLYVYDNLNPFNPVSGCYITSNDFGDRTHVWEATRVMPGFTQAPVPGNTGAPAARCTPLIQMQAGTPAIIPSRYQQQGQKLSDNGFFNVVVSGRLIRFKLEFYGTAEIALGEVMINQTGQV